MKIANFMDQVDRVLLDSFQITASEATTPQLHTAVGRVVMDAIAKNWYESSRKQQSGRCACYFSSEYMVGRLVYNNLYSLGILDDVRKAFEQRGLDLNVFEDVSDAALGTGGLGRLAACFMDSAATLNLPLIGYGLRYRYGLFKQRIKDGFQSEVGDCWQTFGDPWSVPREDLAVTVRFADQTVRAVPYDCPVIGYGTTNVGTLRLWQAFPVNEFDFSEFNNGHYDKAVAEKNAAENLTFVLYPNDNETPGKILRLKQQYLLASASLQDLVRRLKKQGVPMKDFYQHVTIQLNDTHPTVGIPELIRLLMNEHLTFEEAFEVARKTFNYTNHTIMAEALEKWNVDLFRSVLPEIYDIIFKINTRLCGELMAKGIECSKMAIVQDKYIRMAYLATYCSKFINGVAPIHSEILKTDVLHDWYELYPERFHNKTNGISPRRWLGLCNPELTAYIEARVKGDCMANLNRITELRDHLSDEDVLAFHAVKQEKKRQFSAYVKQREGVDIPPEFVFDIHTKRLHEYKRQLMNAFSILDIYYGIKDGRITHFPPTAFIFGAVAAPGYARAKGIIKFINEIAKMIDADPEVRNLMRVVYLQGYNCTYAEHIMPATDISEQISPAGSEASGSGNMKMMLNGAVTLCTMDGANVEIVRLAGAENNYVFGHSAEELNAIRPTYDARAIYNCEPRIRHVVDTLVDGTFSDGGTGIFKELHTSLLDGASWHKADNYFVLLELLSYIDKKLEAIYDTQDVLTFGRKALINVASASYFSSDRAIRQYSEETWDIKPIQ